MFDFCVNVHQTNTDPAIFSTNAANNVQNVRSSPNGSRTMSLHTHRERERERERERASEREREGEREILRQGRDRESEGDREGIE